MPSFPLNVSPDHLPSPVGSAIGGPCICDTPAPVVSVRFLPAWKLSFSVHGSMLRVGWPKVTLDWRGVDRNELRNAVWRWGWLQQVLVSASPAISTWKALRHDK